MITAIGFLSFGEINLYFLGDAIVQLTSKKDLIKAKKHNRENIGSRYVVVKEINEVEFFNSITIE